MDIGIKIYSANTLDFANNGYGFLTDVISAEVEEEINGEYVLNIEYPIGGHLSEYLVRENIIKCPIPDGYDLFRIKYIDRNFKTLMIKAYHISYDLGDDLVINTAPTNLQAQAFGRWIINNASTHASNYTFTSNISSTASARYIRKNVLECFMSNEDNSMLNKFGGEFLRRNYNIALNTRLGQDKGVKLLVGKNINEIKITIDDTSLYTRICPVGYDGLTLPEIFVDSPLINNYPHPKECVIKFDNIKYDETGEDPDAYHNLNDFYDALRAAANGMFTAGLDKPLINVDIDWIDLSKTKEYENYTSLETIRIGDTLTCDMDDFYFTTRVISTTYNPLLDRITNFQIGKTISSYATTMNATIQEVESQDTSSLLEEAQKNATEMLKNAMTGYIYFDYESGNLYIMDNPNPDDAEKVWRWNLNGLGYSSTGINGTYGLAITMDGSIVADYITTGTLNTNVIQGYDSLVSQVEELYNLIDTKTGEGTITLENANTGVLHKLEISGNISLLYPNESTKYGYPLIISDDLIVSDDIYISGGIPYVEQDALYPSTTLYPKNSYLRVDDTDYYLDLDYLNYMNENVYDKWICQEGKQYIERNVGIDSNGDMYALDNPVIELKPDLWINVGETSTLTLLSLNDAILTAEYMVQNEYSQNFATQVYVNSSITQTRDEIEAKVQAVSDSEGEITAASIKLAINNDTSEIKLKGDQIGLEGTITANEGFMIDLNGNMTCNDANINGDIITPTGVLTNMQFECETWGWNKANAYSGSNGGFIGFNYESINTGGTITYNVFKSFLNFCVDIPSYFTIKSAKIRLRHSPMEWRNPTLTSIQKGSCKNLKVYHAEGLGTSGYGNYYGEVVIGGTAPTLTALTTTPSSLTFSDTTFEEKEIELPISEFSTSGVHNIVVETTDSLPTGVDYNNAYQKLGAKTGILTGTLELIGYTSNV